MGTDGSTQTQLCLDDDYVSAFVGSCSTQLLGRWGEDRAAEWLVRQGVVIVDRNWRFRGGELDIVAFTSLKREVLDLNSHFPPPTEYLRQGWRSLSLVGPTFARVLFAHPDAPDFLRNNLGRSIVFDVGISL